MRTGSFTVVLLSLAFVWLANSAAVNLGVYPPEQCVGSANALKDAMFPAGNCAKDIIFPTRKRSNNPNGPSATSGDYGHFGICRTIDDAGADQYVFSSISNDELDYVVGLECPAEGDLLTFTLPFKQSYSISGIVRDANSTLPIAGAIITSGEVNTTAAEDGSYTLGGLFNGSNILTVSSSGYLASTADVTIVNLNVAGVDFYLKLTPVQALGITVSFRAFNQDDELAAIDISNSLIASPSYDVLDSCSLNIDSQSCDCLEGSSSFENLFWEFIALDVNGCNNESPAVFSLTVNPSFNISGYFTVVAVTAENVNDVAVYIGEWQRNLTEISSGDYWRVFSYAPNYAGNATFTVWNDIVRNPYCDVWIFDRKECFGNEDN